MILSLKEVELRIIYLTIKQDFQQRRGKEDKGFVGRTYYETILEKCENAARNAKINL